MSFSLKPYVNFNVDEAIVAQKLHSEFPKGSVFLSIKDIGIDLVLLKDNSKAKSSVRIQVKGSKHHYDPKIGPGDGRGIGWVTLSKKKLIKYTKIVDYMVFIIHHVVVDKKNSFRFEPYYVVIPPVKLLELAKKYKKKSKKGDYNFYFRKEKNIVIDTRDTHYELTKYLNNWKQL